jgi:hypothetical protein
MRLLTGVFLLLFAGIFVYYQAAQDSHDETEVKQSQSADTMITATVHTPETQSEHSEPYDARKDCLYRIYLLSTIFGVFVALGGIYAIYKQTEATKKAAEATSLAAEATARSAKAAEDSVKLQESAFKPWVNIGNWEIWIEKKTSKLRIRFEVINPTELPIDLDVITFEADIMAKDRREQYIPVKGLLSPNNPYIVDGELELGEKLIEILLNSKPLVARIDGSITFSDIRSKYWEQTFKKFLIFDKDILDAGEPPNNRITPHVRDMENQLRPRNG